MRKKPTSIDGFIPRRATRSVGEPFVPETRRGKSQAWRPISKKPLQATQASQDAMSTSVSRHDIDESLNNIVDEPIPKKKRRFFRRRRSASPSRRRVVKRVVIVLAIILLAIGAFIGIKAFIAGSEIFKGNLFDIFQNKSLKMDANGRTNILVLGSTDDDPNHPGNNLTDTMMVVSIDQNKKNAYMFSIPRDLYVDYGRACDSGYQGKINVYFSCSNTSKTDAAEQDRLTQTERFVGGIFGLDIQYGVHVNSVVVRDAVNAVGGVDVDIKGSGGAPGILDRNFDGQCRYTCYWVKYDNGVHRLDGAHAMYLSMARGDHAPTYGLGNSNFDREKNQQKIIIALKKKATSTGTITNVGKITSLIDAMGKNLRTNFHTSEIRTLMTLGKDIPADKIKTISFIDADPPLYGTGMLAGQSVVQPSAGLYNYSAIQAFVKKSLTSNDITREAAHVAAFNASDVEGYAQKQADKLTKLGFTVSVVENVPAAGKYSPIEVYQIGKGNPATKAKLASIYGVSVKTTPPPFAVSNDIDFVVIYSTATSSNDT